MSASLNDPGVTMTDPDPLTIYAAATHCDVLLADNVSLIEAQSAIFEESNIVSSHFLQDSHARFNAWASYTGAFAEEKFSLDRRLEVSVEVRDMVLRLLKVLRRNLDRCEDC